MDKRLPPVEHTWTTGRLIEHLRNADPSGEALVSLAGSLRVLRVKHRGTIVDIEAAESVARDPYTGRITVHVPD